MLTLEYVNSKGEYMNIYVKIISLALVISAPLCAATQADTKVTTQVTKKTPSVKKTEKTVQKTKTEAHKPETAAKTDGVKKSTVTTRQARAQKMQSPAKGPKTIPVNNTPAQQGGTAGFVAPVSAAPLLAGAASTGKALTVTTAAHQGSLKAQANHKAFKDNSLLYALEQHPQVSTFTQRLKQHHLSEILAGKGEYTVFAPLDESFAAGKHLTDAKLEEHIVKGNIDTQALRNQKGALKTLSKGTITIQEKDGHLYANNAQVVGHGIKTKNGQIHFVKDIITQ